MHLTTSRSRVLASSGYGGSWRKSAVVILVQTLKQVSSNIKPWLLYCPEHMEYSTSPWIQELCNVRQSGRAWTTDRLICPECSGHGQTDGTTTDIVLSPTVCVKPNILVSVISVPDTKTTSS